MLHGKDPGSDRYSPHAVTLGAFRVTALYDGHFDLPTTFMELRDDQAPVTDATFRLDVNTFLIQSATKNYLIDTGAGAKLGPNVNKLADNLQAAGLVPADIDAVLCTHIHPDHTNGLIDIDNTALFHNAQIFVHQTEIDFWLSDDQYSRAPAEMRQQYDWAREAFAPYAGRIEPFLRGEVCPGIEAIPLIGHTPGHSGFQIDGGGNQQLVIWGDAVHDIELQSRDPNIAVQADISQAAARATRLSLFDRVAADDVLVTGMHVTYPGFGRLRHAGSGFAYVPEI